jgi:hypothetical protein
MNNEGEMMRKTKRMRIALLSVVATFAVSAGFSAVANAAPLQVVFDSAALDIGPLLKGVDVLDNDPNTSGHQGTNKITVTGDVPAYTGTQTFTIPSGPGSPAAGFDFPVWSAVTAGQNLTIDVIMDTNLTGTYDFTTGALTTSPANFRAVITTQDADVDNDPMTVDPGIVNECEIGVVDGGTAGSALLPLKFSTENTPTPPAGSFLGERFTPAFPPGVGAITSLWTDLPQAVATDPTPESGENCALVQGIEHGAGGLWIAKGKGVGGFTRQPTPSNPAPTPTPNPTPVHCKKGQKLVKGKCVKKKKKKHKK